MGTSLRLHSTLILCILAVGIDYGMSEFGDCYLCGA